MFVACLPGAYRADHVIIRGIIMRTNLTPAFVARAAADPGSDRTIFWDVKMPGFGLVITANGHRSWCVQYRAGHASRRMVIKGTLSLDAARRKAKILLGKIADGGDPLGERREERAAELNTLRSVSAEYLRREGKNLRSIERRRATLERLVYPTMGARQITGIKRSEIVRLLDRIEDERGPVAADSTLAFLRRVMNWQASRSDEFRSPIVRGMSRTKPHQRARSRILTDNELRQVWTAASEMEGPFPALVQFLLLTAARRNEAARMEWCEIDGTDWTLPARRNKTKVDLVRPLSKAAQAVLAELPRIDGCPYVFTAGGQHPISGFNDSKKRIDQASGVSDWRLHDLRRTARTLLSRAGVVADHAERCLGHVIRGVRAVYDRHSFHQEQQLAFEALSVQIERIVHPQESVVAMARK
jgi:integrase